MTSVPANARLPFHGRDQEFKFLRVPVEQFIVIEGPLSPYLIHRRIEAVSESTNDFSCLPTLRCLGYFHMFLTVV
jgi:hypothetical protein